MEDRTGETDWDSETETDEVMDNNEMEKEQ